jgi:hypothetical protein
LTGFEIFIRGRVRSAIGGQKEKDAVRERIQALNLMEIENAVLADRADDVGPYSIIRVELLRPP